MTDAQSESTDDGWYAALENSVALDLFASAMPTGSRTTRYVPYSGLEEIADRLGRRTTLVDLGCGLGWPGLWVARSIGATLTGIDRSPAAIAMAKRAAGSEFPDVRATFVAADATATGLPVRATDAVMSLDVVQAVTDHQAFFDEVVRFVRPGRHIALTTWEARGGSDAPRFPRDVGRLMTEAGLVVEAIEERPAWRDQTPYLPLRAPTLCRADHARGGRSAGNLYAMGNGGSGDKKYVDGHIPYDPETTLARVEVVIGLHGSGGVGASFFQDRRPPPGSREANAARDQEANAALLRQAAEMVLEHAENMLRRPPHRPPE